MTSIPSRSRELRAADSERGAHVHLPRARHELRGDDDAVAHAGVGGEQAADDALALAAAVDLGRVEEDDARLDAGLPGLADGRLGQRLVVAAHAPGALVAPGPGPDAEGRDGDVGAGELDPISGLRWRGVAHCAASGGRGPGQVGLDGRPPLRGVRQLRRVVRARDDGQPPVGHLAGQLGRLVDQRVVVLAHDDGRRAGDGGEPGAQGAVVVGGVAHQLAPEALDGVGVHAGEDGVLLLPPLGRRAPPR